MKLKDSKLGLFLKDKAPKVLEIAGDLLPDAGTLGIVKNLIEHTVVDKAEREAIKDEIDANRLDFERDMFKLEVEDRKDSRRLYMDDSLIQKMLALLFTVAYFLILHFLFRHFVTHEISLGEFEIGFISTMFGGMSTKINTIIDFFFGGSAPK